MLEILRKFQKGDLRKVAEIYQKAFTQELWGEKWSLLEAKRRIDELTVYPHSLSYVYELNGEILGCIICSLTTWYSGKQLEIKELFVEPQAQSKGIGTKLLKKIEAVVREQKINEIMLWTLRGGELQKFYYESGYVPVSETIIMKKIMEV